MNLSKLSDAQLMALVDELVALRWSLVRRQTGDPVVDFQVGFPSPKHVAVWISAGGRSVSCQGGNFREALEAIYKTFVQDLQEVQGKLDRLLLKERW